jgi:hypothetical protein
MYEEIARVRGDTSALRRLEANTAAVERLAGVIVPLEGTILRFSRFGGRVPQRRNGAKRSGPLAEDRDAQPFLDGPAG